MNRLAITLLLAAFSGSAAAEWVPVAWNDDTTFYADPETIRKSGTVVKMWSLADLKTAEYGSGGAYLSLKEQSEYDCKEERTRILYVYNYSGQMSYGKAVYSGSGNDEWVPVAPSSINESLWKFACGKN